MIGVDYNLFWTLCPNTYKPFTRAFERKLEMEDEALWRQGVYNRLAVASVMSNKCKYPEQPILRQERLNNDPEYQRKKAKAQMLQFMEMANNDLRKRGGL